MADLQELKERLKQAERELDRLQGRKEQLEQSLRAFGCNSLEEAEKLYEKLLEEVKRKSAKHEKEKKDFLEKYNMERDLS